MEDLDETVDAIVAYGQKQTARTGYSAEKAGLKVELADTTWIVCCGLQSLASPAFYNEYQTARSIVDSAASPQTKVVETPLPMELPKAA